MQEEVECDFCLVEEDIPKFSWESWIDSSKHSEQVCFEGAYHAFGIVVLVHVRR